MYITGFIPGKIRIPIYFGRVGLSAVLVIEYL